MGIQMNLNRLKALSGLIENWDEQNNSMPDQVVHSETDVKQVPMDLWRDILHALNTARYCDHDAVSEVLDKIESMSDLDAA